MAHTDTLTRLHSIVVREADGSHTVVTHDSAGGGELRGFRSREEALTARDSLRRAAAAAGQAVHATGCCG